MRAAIASGLAAALALGLSACGRGDREGAADQTTGGTAETPGASAPPAPELRRRPGLWELRMSQTGVDFVQVVRICLDAETDRQTAVWAAQSTDACVQESAARAPDGTWTFRARCDFGSGGVQVVEGTATGDFETRYQVRTSSTTSGAEVPHMNRTETANVDAAWIGACPQDMRPGDMELPGGVRMTMRTGR